MIELFDKVANTRNISIKFDSTKPQIFIKGDCNNFFGTFTLQGNNLTFGPIPGSRKSCSETIDQTFIEKISGNTITYSVTKNTLTLFHNNVKIAVFQKDNYSNIIQYLSKYTWKMHILNDKTLTGITPTIQFDTAKNTVHGFSGCNNYSGNVAFTTNTITFDKVISTMRGCLDENSIEMERAMHQLFGDKQLTLEVVDQTLNIYKNDQLITTFIRDLKKVRTPQK